MSFSFELVLAEVAKAPRTSAQVSCYCEYAALRTEEADLSSRAGEQAEEGWELESGWQLLLNVGGGVNTCGLLPGILLRGLQTWRALLCCMQIPGQARLLSAAVRLHAWASACSAGSVCVLRRVCDFPSETLNCCPAVSAQESHVWFAARSHARAWLPLPPLSVGLVRCLPGLAVHQRSGCMHPAGGPTRLPACMQGCCTTAAPEACVA